MEKSDLLVIKIGTNALRDRQRDGINTKLMGELAEQIFEYEETGGKVAIVSSGAIGFSGRRQAYQHEAREDLDLASALSTMGQPHLAVAWDKALIGAGQVLVNRHDLERPEERSKFVRTVAVLHKLNVIPVINGNDALSDEEIRYGDNDTLSARAAERLAISGLYRVARLVLLSDVKGLYRKFPAKNREKYVRQVNNIDWAYRCINETGTEHGTGHMRTKLDAAKIASAAGIDMWIADAAEYNVIPRSLAGETGTYFPAQAN